MPSTVHEVLIEMFRHRPGLVAEILTSTFAIEMTGWTNAQIMSSDLREELEALMSTATSEYRDYL